MSLLSNVVLGTSLSKDTLERIVSGRAPFKQGKQWTGNFVKFVRSRTNSHVDSMSQLISAPEGAEILVREHYECDVVALKNNGIWVITQITDRRH